MTLDLTFISFLLGCLRVLPAARNAHLTGDVRKGQERFTDRDRERRDGGERPVFSRQVRRVANVAIMKSTKTRTRGDS